MNPNLFNKIYNEEVEPPVEVWENIEAYLDNKPSNKYGWLRNIAAVLLIGLIGGASYYYFSSNSDNKNSNEEQVQEVKVPESKVEKNEIQLPESNKTQIVIQQKQGKTEEDISYKKPSGKNKLVSSEDNVGFTKTKRSANSSPNKIVNPRYSSTPKRNTQNISEKENDNTPLFGSSFIDSSSTNTSIPSLNSNDALLTSTEKDLIESSHLNASEALEYANSILDGNTNSIIKFESPKNNFISPSLDEDYALDKVDLKEKYKAATKNDYNFSKNWSVRSYVAPSTTRSLNNNDIWVSDLAYYKGKYNDENNYGLNLQYAFNQKLKLRMGLERIAMSQTAIQVPVAFSYINTSNSIVYTGEIKIVNSDLIANDPNAVQNLQFTNVYQEIGYVSVPLEVGYEFLKWKKFGFGAYFGGSANFLSKNKLTIFNDDIKANIGESSNLNRVVFGSQISIMAQVKLSNTLSIFLEPRTIFYLNTFNDKNSVRPFTFNLNTGLGFRF